MQTKPAGYNILEGITYKIAKGISSKMLLWDREVAIDALVQLKVVESACLEARDYEYIESAIELGRLLEASGIKEPLGIFYANLRALVHNLNYGADHDSTKDEVKNRKKVFEKAKKYTPGS